MRVIIAKVIIYHFWTLAFDLPEYGTSINSVAQHPGRTNLILGGTSDGNIYIWDIRQEKIPIVKLGSHIGRVNNVSDLSSLCLGLIMVCFRWNSIHIDQWLFRVDQTEKCFHLSGLGVTRNQIWERKILPLMVFMSEY